MSNEHDARILLDPYTVAAAVFSMTEESALAMDNACGDDPFRVSAYLIDRFGLDGLCQLAEKHRAEAVESIDRAIRDLKVAR